MSKHAFERTKAEMLRAWLRAILVFLFGKVCGYCGMCGRWFVYPRRRRMNTAYVNDAENFCTVCAMCFEEVERGWDELWAEYWAGRP